MAIYAIYHINLLKSREQNLAVYDVAPAAPQSYRLEFEKILSKGTIPVYKTEKDGSKTLLDCFVKARHDGVTMLMLNNEKSHKYLEGKNTEQLTYHPGCYVFIDNRPGVALMAIERTNSFESQPDKVRDLLQEAFSNILKDREITVDIRARLHATEFWDAIDEQCQNLNDSVRRVSFDFPNPDTVKNLPKKTPVELTRRLKIIASLTKVIGAAKGTLNMEADKEHALLLDRTQADMANMVALCCETGYNISVRFKNYGLYRFGNNIRSFAQLPEVYIDEFLTGESVAGKVEEGMFEISRLFVVIQKSDNLYMDEEPTTPKRKNRH